MALVRTKPQGSPGLPRVVLMDDYMDQARHMRSVQELARLSSLTIFTQKAGSQDELLQRLQGADLVITIRDRVMFDRSILSRMRGVELLSVCGPRLQPHVDLAAATEAGLPVCCSPANTQPAQPHHATAELAWALILGLAKNLVHNQAVLGAGGWQSVPGTGLAGKTLALVGSTGKVGSVVARIGAAMGMRMIAWSPRLTPEVAAQQGVQAVPFDEVLRQADVLSLHANLTAQSRSMLGAAQFATMKSSAILINTARAGLVDEGALRDALDGGKLAGAGLDVFWEEPLPPGHWVRHHAKVLLTPHLGAFTPEGYEWIVAPGVEAALAWLKGEPVDVANPDAAGRGRA